MACPITQIIEYLEHNVSVIIEFGNHSSTFCYLLIANIITRRIHKEYVKRTERFLGTQHESDRPCPLIIAIEEAHKFLNPRTASQTIFGTISREMRKYYVSLLVIDQRPSEIDQEIVSQIGTKIIAQLTDDKDISAVLIGAPHSSHLRVIISTLDTKKQILVVGHATPMPVVVNTRDYNEQFYHDMQQSVTPVEVETLIQELF
jgi:DNA helicase HerA-like ATPase